jgi:hypothetical protein
MCIVGSSSDDDAVTNKEYDGSIVIVSGDNINYNVSLMTIIRYLHNHSTRSEESFI